MGAAETDGVVGSVQEANGVVGGARATVSSAKESAGARKSSPGSRWTFGKYLASDAAQAKQSFGRGYHHGNSIPSWDATSLAV
jgi:hypothetical protein